MLEIRPLSCTKHLLKCREPSLRSSKSLSIFFHGLNPASVPGQVSISNLTFLSAEAGLIWHSKLRAQNQE